MQLFKPVLSVLLLHPPTHNHVSAPSCDSVWKRTHYCSLHSKADIHNSRWFSIFAPLWTRCWCPPPSGTTWGPLWWPRPPPGTWAVWAGGWCPKAFWGSRRATCASRWEERTRGGGVMRQSESAWQRQRGSLQALCMTRWDRSPSWLKRGWKSCMFHWGRAWRAPAAEILILHWPRVRNCVRDTKRKWLTLQMLHTMYCSSPVKGL